MIIKRKEKRAKRKENVNEKLKKVKIVSKHRKIREERKGNDEYK